MSKKVTIKGKVVFKDKSAVVGAKIKIWETDKKTSDDLIVNDTTNSRGEFSGSGKWKDSTFDIATYRYELTYKGESKSKKGILDKSFFKTLQTGWLSPEQEEEKKIKEEKKEEKKTISLSGQVIFKDKTPAQGVRVKIWETDNFKRNNDDDLVVNILTDKNGFYSGKLLKDDKGIQTFRWEVSVSQINFVEKSKLTELPKSELKTIKLKTELPGWKNWIEDLSTFIESEFIFTPKTIQDLKLDVAKAISNNKKIKVVGSGHSHSNIAKPENFNSYFDLKKLSGERELYDWLKPDISLQNKNQKFENEPEFVKNYIRVKAGTKLRTLYREILAPKKLGLINMGPFDGQTIAGLVNTNTHGTGLSLPGFSDMVRSVEMLVLVPNRKGETNVEHWFIEPTNGMSDPIKFKGKTKDKVLVQNDDVFHSVICGYGLFGVVCTYTIAVRDLYWMQEWYQPISWGGFKKQMDDGELLKFLNKKNNYQTKLYINTGECIRDGGILDKTSLRIDTWRISKYKDKPAGYPNGGIHPIWPPMRERDLDYGLQKILEPASFNPQKLSNLDISAVSTSVMKSMFMGKSGQTKFQYDYDSTAYYRAIRRGRDNNLDLDKGLSSEQSKIDNTMFNGDPIPRDYGPSIEVSVPVEQTIEAIEIVMDIIAKAGVKFIAPTGVRFTAKSNHLLSPTYGRDSAFIELAAPLPSKNMNLFDWTAGGSIEPNANSRKEWPQFMTAYNKGFKKIFKEVSDKIKEARFHKGKYNDYNWKLLQNKYPDSFNTWIEYYKLFSCSEFLDCENSVKKWQLKSLRPDDKKMEYARKLSQLATIRS
jgi:hypothetical protein